MKCLYCGTALSSHGPFCKNCGRPVRCKHCGNLLELNANACVSCGVFIGEGGVPTDRALVTPDTAINSFELEETRTSRKVKARFTNEAVNSIGAMLGASIMGTAATPPYRGRPVIVSADPESSIEQEPPVVPRSAYEDTKKFIPATIEDSGSELDESARIGSVFRRDGDGLRLDQTQLKAKSRPDAVRRITALALLYVLVLEGRDKLSRDELNAILKDAGVFDSNSSRSFVDTDFAVDAESIGLRAPGRANARKYLDELFDPAALGEWELGTAPRARSPRSLGTRNDGQEAGMKPTGTRKRSSKQATKWTAAWRGGNFAVDGHTALLGKSLADKGIFGLWAIRRATNDETKEVSRGNLKAFLWQAFETKVDDRALQRALLKEKEKVAAVHGATFQVTPTGMRHAEQMAGSDVAPSPTMSASRSEEDSP